jgi:hypothetical protein
MTIETTTTTTPDATATVEAPEVPVVGKGVTGAMVVVGEPVVGWGTGVDEGMSVVDAGAGSSTGDSVEGAVPVVGIGVTVPMDVVGEPVVGEGTGVDEGVSVVDAGVGASVVGTAGTCPAQL